MTAVANPGRTKALVVDDSRAMRLILRQMLNGLGFEVSEAEHGKDALQHLKANPDTALALVDWNMPEMNGLELIQALRSDQSFNELRLMMVTTETELTNVERALGAGANEYIMKPFSKDAILEKLSILGFAG
ncbi:MAG: response regulator [Vicinamibacterales bacterium]